MQNPPKISIIIPTLNEESTIGPLLCLLSSCEGLEIIVSDGGSRDRTLEICQGYSARMLVGPPGRGGQMNRAATVAQAPVLLFLHADCRINSGLFNEILKVVGEGRSWGCATMVFDNQAFFYRMVSWFSNLRSRLFNSCYGDQVIFCCRNFFEQIGGYPDWPLLEDVEFSRRARLRQRACILPQTVITSARRFELRGRWYTLSLMQWIKLLNKLGVSPQKLAILYQGKRRVTCANCSSNDE